MTENEEKTTEKDAAEQELNFTVLRSILLTKEAALFAAHFGITLESWLNTCTKAYDEATSSLNYREKEYPVATEE
jgi:hypothetical protein